MHRKEHELRQQLGQRQAQGRRVADGLVPSKPADVRLRPKSKILIAKILENSWDSVRFELDEVSQLRQNPSSELE